MANTQPSDTGRLAMKSGVTQLGSRLFDVAVTWLLSIVVLRYLAPEGFGDYSLIVGLVGLIGVFAEFGLPQVATREIARDPEVEGAAVGSAIAIRLTLGVLSIGIVQALLSFYGPSTELRLAALIASAAFLMDAVISVVVFFQVRLVQHLEAAARVVGTIVRAAATLLAVRADWGLVGMLSAQLLSLAAVAAVSLHLLRTRMTSRPVFDRKQTRSMIRAALAVGPAALVGVLYLKLDVIMLGLLEDRTSVGIYGAAYQPIEYLFLLTVVVVQVLLPLVAAVALTNHSEFSTRYRFGCNLLGVGYGLIAVGIIALAPDAVQFLYDTPFAGAADPMMVLGLSIGLLALNAWQGVVLLSIGQQHRSLAYISIAAGFNVLIDLVLIRQFGYIGAAYGTLITAIALVTMSTIGLHRHAKLSFGRAPWLLFAAAITGCLASLGARSLIGNGLISAAIGVLAWTAVAAPTSREIVDGARAIARAKAPVTTGTTTKASEL